LGFGVRTLGFLLLDLEDRTLLHSRNVRFAEDVRGGDCLQIPHSSVGFDTNIGDEPVLRRRGRPPLPPEQPLHPQQQPLPTYGPRRPRGRPPGTTAQVMAERRAREAQNANSLTCREMCDSSVLDRDMACSPQCNFYEGSLESVDFLPDSPEIQDPYCKFSNSIHLSSIKTPPTPRNFNEAITSLESAEWLKAMELELASLKMHAVWSLVPRPIGIRVINTKWVFTRKLNPDGSLRKHKARLVVAAWNPAIKVGCPTYSPVVQLSSIRLILAITAARGYKLKFLDVTTAYLFSRCTRCVHVAQPPGFTKKGADGQDLVCLLHKSLYGLPESGRNWFFTVTTILKECGLTQSQADPCVFYRIESCIFLALCLFVDDKLVSYSNDEVYENFLSVLRTKLDIVEVQTQQNYLGLQIKQDLDGITLSNEKYIDKKLEAYGLQDLYPVRSLSAELKNLDRCLTSDKVIPTEYQELVGSLLFLSNAVRPDLQFSVVNASQHNRDPRKPHLEAVKRIFRYLKGTSDVKLRFPARPLGKLHICCDASYDSMPESKSVTGYCIRLGKVPLLWRSKKQHKVAHSSCEAELYAMCDALKDLEPVRNLVAELAPECLDYPLTLETDSKSAIDLVTNGGSTDSRHYLRRIQSVRDEVNRSNIRFKFVTSENLLADIFTKNVTGVRMKRMAKDELNLY